MVDYCILSVNMSVEYEIVKSIMLIVHCSYTYS